MTELASAFPLSQAQRGESVASSLSPPQTSPKVSDNYFDENFHNCDYQAGGMGCTGTVETSSTFGGYTEQGLKLREAHILKQRREFLEDNCDHGFNWSWHSQWLDSEDEDEIDKNGVFGGS